MKAGDYILYVSPDGTQILRRVLVWRHATYLVEACRKPLRVVRPEDEGRLWVHAESPEGLALRAAAAL